jgi:phasin protein
MPTIQEEKPAKPRSRSRKADGRSSKGGQTQVEQTQTEQTQGEPTQVEMKAEADPVSPMVAETEVAAVETAPAVPMEQAFEPALSGEVLPPEVIESKSQVDGLQAIAQAYGDYTRKSLVNSRFLIERLMTVRSFDEAIEIQGEFAKQAYTNFLVQSEKICVLYGEWAQQFFRPFVVRF